MIKNTTLEIIFTLLLGVFCLWVIVEGYELSLGNLVEIGPGFLLFFEGIFLGILCLVSLRALFFESGDLAPAFSSSRGLRGVFFVIGLTSLVGFFFEILGFKIISVLFLILLLRYVGEERWTRLLPVAILTILFSYIIFNKLLNIQLPVGPLGF